MWHIFCITPDIQIAYTEADSHDNKIKQQINDYTAIRDGLCGYLYPCINGGYKAHGKSPIIGGEYRKGALMAPFDGL